MILITGGARSGKSSFAIKLAKAQKGKVIYIATADALDSEMKKRITLHKSARRKDWMTIEEPMDILGAVKKVPHRNSVIILDCLTLLISNLMLSGCKDEEIYKKIKAIAMALKRKSKVSIVVTNEVGSGIVPDNELARKFRDLQGRANQIVGRMADCLYLLVSGVPIKIKEDEV